MMVVVLVGGVGGGGIEAESGGVGVRSLQPVPPNKEMKETFFLFVIKIF